MINESAIKAVLEKSLRISKGETCLILTDMVLEGIARQFFEHASDSGYKIHLEVMEPLQEHGQEPPGRIAGLMKSHKVALLITSKSLTHTNARKHASSSGARIASMPGITEGMCNRCLDVDYQKLDQRAEVLSDLISKSSEITVKSDIGTDIVIKKGNRPVVSDTGILDSCGSCGNLPAGEVFFAPSECTGIFVSDASFAGLGRLKSPLWVEVRNGRACGITGQGSDKLKAMLDKVGEDSYVIAEFGIGINHKAKVTGQTLEDEKVLGTCHIALGNNTGFGGNNNVPIHLDCILTGTTVKFDDRVILEKGIHRF